MAGHSKWANIKHRKGAQDAKRAKVFTRIIKEISIASKEGGPDPASNPRLRLAVQNAKGANIPKDTIDRAIKKGSGEGAESYQDVTYEGYAPNGIAIFVEATTDNVNRTVANVRAIFNKYGGALGTNGSLEFIFDRKGVFEIPAEGLDEDEFTLQVIDGGAEEVERTDDAFLVYTSFEDFGRMQKKLEELNIEARNARVERIPATTKALENASAQQVLKLIEKLEEEDDVQQVFHNLELTEELLEALERD